MTDQPGTRISVPVIPFLLTCVLIALKITGHLDVSWLIVFLPMYIGLAVGLLFVLVIGIGALVFLIGGLVWIIIETIIDFFRK